MENCMLPIEICWDIIEAIPASSHFFTPPEYDALVACSLVCRTWNTRAEDILRLDPELDTPQIASQFASTIRRESSGRVRADHISELWLNWSDFEGDKNLSRAMELFMTPLPRLESLHMFGVHIDISPRILRCMSPPLLTGMTHLEFLRCKFCSWRAMLDIVWGCLKLDLLSVENCSFGGNTVTPESIARLGVSRRSLRGCQYLKTLVIMADTNMGMLLPGDVFGDTLMQLALHIPCDALEDITPLFRGTFPRLESIQFWISTVSHEVVYHGARLFCALATGPSPRPTLHSIFINLYFDVILESGGVPTYHPELIDLIIGRAEELDGHPLRSILAGLQQVRIQLYGIKHRADGETCARQVLSVHPDMHDILLVVIDLGEVYPPETTSSSSRTLDLK